MNKAEIYEDAAEIIGDGWETDYSCIAVDLAATGMRGQGCPARVHYQSMFANETDGFGSAYLSATAASAEWGKDGRVLALCFAAAMAETGDL